MMKQILFVDDDAVIVQIYRRKFLQAGFGVEVAGDGLEAMKLLSSGIKPDLVVLDLMMPKMSGVDVLKFIRSRPELKTTPVIIFSNCYMSDMVQAAELAGADRALLKSRCPPHILVEVVDQMLSGAEMPEADTTLLAAADYARTLVAATSGPSPAKQPTKSIPSEESKPADAADGEKAQLGAQEKMHEEFLRNSASTLKTINALIDSFLAATDLRTRQLRLLDLYRKVHFVTSMAGMAGCGQIALFVSAFEALLFEVQEKPELLTVSMIQTITQGVDFLRKLFEKASHSADHELPTANVLVVDDDVISNRLIVTALKRVNLNASSEGDPLVALDRLKNNHYDLILLDISMPKLDGFQLCTALRNLPAHAKTPVIFVTCHSDFESCSHGIRSGGNDLIAKPILAVELAVKAVTHLLRAQMLAH